jgi:hypothetical protein
VVDAQAYVVQRQQAAAKALVDAIESDGPRGHRFQRVQVSFSAATAGTSMLTNASYNVSERLWT